MAERKEVGNHGARTEERRAELLGAEVTAEAGQNGISYLPRIVLVERVSSLKGDVEKLKDNHYI